MNFLNYRRPNLRSRGTSALKLASVIVFIIGFMHFKDSLTMTLDRTEQIPTFTTLSKSDFHKAWPAGGHPAYFKMSDGLTIAIPPQYQRFWVYGGNVVNAASVPKNLQITRRVGFEFFMPDFSGYTEDNFNNQFDENLVQVVRIEAADPSMQAAGAPGSFVPNMRARALARYLNADRYQDKYGLRCYEDRTPTDHRTCFGPRSKSEEIALDIVVPPYGPATRFPLMQAEYFSAKYGGMVVVWRAPIKHLSNWQIIDAQVWRHISSWAVDTSDSIESLK